jgi:hypothetical protein
MREKGDPMRTPEALLDIALDNLPLDITDALKVAGAKFTAETWRGTYTNGYDETYDVLYIAVTCGGKRMLGHRLVYNGQIDRGESSVFSEIHWQVWAHITRMEKFPHEYPNLPRKFVLCEVQ